jgi:uncharacterized Zn-finger protein
MMHNLTHICSHCSRGFKRAEHLTRHLRTRQYGDPLLVGLRWLIDGVDTREKPYACRCGAAFTRRDLLTRHWRLTHHAADPTITKEQPLTSEIATIGVPQQQPSSDVHTIASNELSVTGAGAANGHLARQAHASHLDLHTPAAAFQDAQANLIVQGQ